MDTTESTDCIAACRLITSVDTAILESEVNNIVSFWHDVDTVAINANMEINALNFNFFILKILIVNE